MSGIAVLRSLGGADGARLPFLGKVTSGEDAGLRRRDRLTRLALAGAFKGRPTWPHWERARLRPRGDRIRARRAEGRDRRYLLRDLPDPGGVLQGRGARRHQQDAPGRALLPVAPLRRQATVSRPRSAPSTSAIGGRPMSFS